MRLVPLKTLPLVIPLIFAASGALGDFYRFQTEDGVEVFTNTPTNSNAVKIMKEDVPRKAALKKLVIKKADQEENKHFSQSDENQHLQIPVSGTISSRYGWRHDPIDGNFKHHNGVDIAVAAGTPVRSVAPGRVTFSGNRGGYGNLVIVEHDGGVVSLYGHNSLLLVSTGQLVDAQTTIALSGSTGRSTGPHLHFELWKNNMNLTQAYVDDRRDSFKNATVAANRIEHQEIRRFVEKNGTIVFTNLPQ